MAKYLGLRGETLGLVRILLVVVPSFFLFGYNQSAIGGTLSFTSFTKHFPRIDTTNTKGALKAENARIQGKHLNTCASLLSMAKNQKGLS
jgi:hypothetical protein